MRFAAVVLVALCLAAAPAAAAPGLEVGIEDERILLTEPANAPAAVAAWKELGVDVVRLHARWGRLAPAQRGGPYDWTELDAAVQAVRASGLPIMLTLTGPGPLWTSTRPELGIPVWKPDPRAFARFASDVATRYAADIARYLIWNEPNIPGWLQPQWECTGKRCAMSSPHIYRGLVRAAVPAIRRADPTAEIVMGELAPVGRGAQRATGRPAPLAFLREMACVDGAYKPLRTRPCRAFKPARADSFGYHPHGILRAPDVPNPNRDEAQMGDLSRLFKVLDRLSARRRLLPRGPRFSVHLTEFGYQTSPPDHVVGVTLAEQVRYLQQAAYIAWRHPRVRSLVHYQWVDDPVHYRSTGAAAYSGWQSGLHLIDGRPKPALLAFPQPFVVDRSGRSKSARFWGQVRPGSTHEVTLQRRRRGAGAFADMKVLVTDSRGYWSLVGPVSSAYEYRFMWRAETGFDYAPEEERYSGVVAPGVREPKRLKASSAP